MGGVDLSKFGAEGFRHWVIGSGKWGMDGASGFEAKRAVIGVGNWMRRLGGGMLGGDVARARPMSSESHTQRRFDMPLSSRVEVRLCRIRLLGADIT